MIAIPESLSSDDLVEEPRGFLEGYFTLGTSTIFLSDQLIIFCTTWTYEKKKEKIRLMSLKDVNLVQYVMPMIFKLSLSK